ncbi:bacteriohemerythrin [Treponema sp.]|uniref:bacteriohemerythrin n=1 Tax=Treponema sp. TaxID=166 RepID=UPI003F042A7E
MIEKIEWSDSYILGIPEIDNQHKKLVQIANELYDAALGSDENYSSEMEKILKKLTDYTVYHFSSEENFMRAHEYIGSDAHKTAHDNFVNEVNYQIKKLSADKKEDGQRFYSYIVGWVLNHIAKADRVWANFVKSKQV